MHDKCQFLGSVSLSHPGLDPGVGSIWIKGQGCGGIFSVFSDSYWVLWGCLLGHTWWANIAPSTLSCYSHPQSPLLGSTWTLNRFSEDIFDAPLRPLLQMYLWQNVKPGLLTRYKYSPVTGFLLISLGFAAENISAFFPQVHPWGLIPALRIEFTDLSHKSGWDV